MRHIELNNELLQRNADGFFRLEKDLEAVEAFMEEVERKTLTFTSHREKIDHMIKENYYENVYEHYSPRMRCPCSN